MQRIHRRLRLVVLVGMLGSGVVPADAWANGNYSHLWMTTDALSYLEDGGLQDLLTRPELLDIIRNGAMYPDGGYVVGDGYGEISHWEPFHLTYLDWIRTNFQPPWSPEAAQHIAFLMGMTAHGISDQLYDGMYLERAAFYDENGSDATLLGLDAATDACFAATQGLMELPETWVPAEVLAPLYEIAAGHSVEASTIEQGQALVIVAVMVANDAIGIPETMDEYMTLYPWACGNQDNPEIPGSPVTHGPVIARYWSVLWERLHGGEVMDQPLIGTFFTGSTPYGQMMDSSNPDSRVSFAMPWGLDPSTVDATSVVVTGEDGDVHPVGINVYYGANSHLVNLKPTEDWAQETSYTVTISPPISDWTGSPIGTTHTFTFSTGPEPRTPSDGDHADVADNPETDDGRSGKRGGCAATDQAPPLPVLLLLLGLLVVLWRKAMADILIDRRYASNRLRDAPSLCDSSSWPRPPPCGGLVAAASGGQTASVQYEGGRG